MAKKKRCHYGVNKNTGHCLKTKRSHSLSGSRRRKRRRR
jgi:hypothetical protein